MEIKSQPQNEINTIANLKTSENENVKLICQELKNICTVSYQLITPKISLKMIRKKKIIQQKNNNDPSKKETSTKQNKKSIQNQFDDTKEQLESKIALINELQTKLLFLKLMISKM
ncbi:unnamed protein product [Paramecium sonneborni]|uniref:Uncharacterized protein n=1 Tax=Paramecium sonneborni TaxID=65129 RepID=A0A8S1PDE6_9CILI|nr:unnamed protein product [Paramecium sonneborni]